MCYVLCCILYRLFCRDLHCLLKTMCRWPVTTIMHKTVLFFFLFNFFFVLLLPFFCCFDLNSIWILKAKWRRFLAIFRILYSLDYHVFVFVFILFLLRRKEEKIISVLSLLLNRVRRGFYGICELISCLHCIHYFSYFGNTNSFPTNNAIRPSNENFHPNSDLIFYRLVSRK